MIKDDYEIQKIRDTAFCSGYNTAVSKYEKRNKDLEKENAELKKNYEDSLVAYGVLKAKVDTLAQPSPLESMQDALIATQKVANEKQKEQLTKAKEIIKELLNSCFGYNSKTVNYEVKAKAEQFISEVEK